MNELKLVEATLEYAGQLWQFRKEVFEHDPDDGNRFAGCMSIESASSAEKWIKMCQMRKSEATAATKLQGLQKPAKRYYANFSANSGGKLKWKSKDRKLIDTETE